MLARRGLPAGRTQEEVESSLLSLASEEDEEVQFDSKQRVLF